MKFLITITKDVIDRSLMCGTKGHTGLVTHSCAFAVAYNELAKCLVGLDVVIFFDAKGDTLVKLELTEDQRKFVTEFDDLIYDPRKRYSLVGRQFEVEIPDEIINHYYGDSVKAAQKIINNPILQTV